MKNLLNKKLVIAYIGKNSFLAKHFVKKYRRKFLFKPINIDIRKVNNISKWFLKNPDINIFINFAAVTSVKECNLNKKKSFNINYQAPINLLNLINESNLNDFRYFLCLSTSHVFKPSKFKVKEESKKKSQNYYGQTKHYLEKFILKNNKKYFFKIGIARIFNYYNKNSKKSFFINDIKKILSNNEEKIYFKKISTFRDFISINNITTALYKMVQLNLKGDFNICSGEKIFLPDIVKHLNNKMKNKILIFDNIKTNGIVGSNLKLKKKGWIYNKKDFFKEL